MFFTCHPCMCQSLLNFHMSFPTCHYWFITSNLKLLTCHSLKVSLDMSLLSCPSWHLTLNIWLWLVTFRIPYQNFTVGMSLVTCHTQCVTLKMLVLACHTNHTEATLHLKQLTLFGMNCRLPENILHRIAQEALIFSDNKEKFWYGHIRSMCYIMVFLIL